MVSEKQVRYRNEYRSRVTGWYNGPLHVAIIYVIGLTAIWIYTQHLENVQWWEWATIPVFLVACNIFEWYLHLKVMHRPQRWSGIPGDLQKAHAAAPSVFHGQRDALQRFQ